MVEPVPASGKGRLSVLVPAATLLFLAVDVSLRAVPLEKMSFRAWDPLQAQRKTRQPFASNRYYENSRSYGDLSSLANLQHLRQYRTERFTTDALGYRNPPDILQGPAPGALVLGDSFAVGAGVNDDETLTVELGRRLGMKIFNAAGRSIPSDQLTGLVRRLGMERGIVFQEITVWDPKPYRETVRMKERTRPLKFYSFNRFFDLSRLKLGLLSLQKKFQDDRIFPNPYGDLAACRRLSNGTVMLFGRTDVEAPTRTDRSDEMSGWRSRADHVKSLGLDFIVILVPTKYAVYRPLIPDDPHPSEMWLSPTRDLEEVLRKAGIRVVNLTEALREAARQAYEAGATIYWLDDTHCNADGIRVAAREIERQLKAGP